MSTHLRYRMHAQFITHTLRPSAPKVVAVASGPAVRIGQHHQPRLLLPSPNRLDVFLLASHPTGTQPEERTPASRFCVLMMFQRRPSFGALCNTVRCPMADTHRKKQHRIDTLTRTHTLGTTKSMRRRRRRRTTRTTHGPPRRLIMMMAENELS